MSVIDYEAEYNNRARVPEHPAIFERWLAEAAAYRALAAREGRSELGFVYGKTDRQRIDLFWPAERGDPKLALFVHGGYWRSLDIPSFSHLARGLNAHGVSVAIAGYDLCPAVRIADIITQIHSACMYLWQRLSVPMLVYGHSAGGQLAACMLATDWEALQPGLPADLVPAACAVSGVFDLRPLVGLAMNADLRLEDDEARRVSPLFFTPPAGRSLDLVVGALESPEFLRQSRSLADSWGAAGVAVRYEEAPAANHFTVLDALSVADSPITQRLARLAELAARSPAGGALTL